eukprot:1313307-Alexandrium_andersonii.AAC.1
MHCLAFRTSRSPSRPHLPRLVPLPSANVLCCVTPAVFNHFALAVCIAVRQCVLPVSRQQVMPAHASCLPPLAASAS